MASSIIGFTFSPITLIENLLDVQKSIKYYLIYIGKHLHVILKTNNNSLDKYYICIGFSNSLYWSPKFLGNFV